MIDLTKVQKASDIAQAEALKVIKTLPKNIGYDRYEIVDKCNLSISRWDHHRLSTLLKPYSKQVQGKIYYFNPKHI